MSEAATSGHLGRRGPRGPRGGAAPARAARRGRRARRGGDAERAALESAGRERAADRRGRRRPRGPHLRLPAEAGRIPGRSLRVLGSARRALLDAPRGLRRRADRRARRRADRPESHPDPPARAAAGAQPRQPALGGGQRDRAVLLLRRPALLVRAGDRRPEADLAADPLGRLRGRLPDALHAVDPARARTRRDVDRGLDPGLRARWLELEAGSAARRRLQHRVRRRDERAELPQHALPAGVLGPGAAADLRPVEREVPRARRKRPDPGATRRRAAGADNEGIGAGRDRAQLRWQLPTQLPLGRRHAAR